MNSNHQLWYVRHGESVVGPFPPKTISRHVLLGRILLTDHVSPDKVNWLALGELPELLPDEALLTADAGTWDEERNKAARRWADERVSSEPVHLKGDRRRIGQGIEGIVFRGRHAEVWETLKKRRSHFMGPTLAFFAAVALFAVVAAALYSPVNPVKVGLAPPTPDCAGMAAPEVNWSGCDKQGLWLAGANLSGAALADTRLNSAQLTGANLSYAKLPDADLSFANLAGAKLVSADLKGTDLSHAELRDADLQYADLRGANLLDASLQAAALDHATWIDGRVCKPGSVGQCL
jgi:hypothetical protein